jgi:hypothetical protein
VNVSNVVVGASVIAKVCAFAWLVSIGHPWWGLAVATLTPTVEFKSACGA